MMECHTSISTGITWKHVRLSPVHIVYNEHTLKSWSPKVNCYKHWKILTPLCEGSNPVRLFKLGVSRIALWGVKPSQIDCTKLGLQGHIHMCKVTSRRHTHWHQRGGVSLSPSITGHNVCTFTIMRKPSSPSGLHGCNEWESWIISWLAAIYQVTWAENINKSEETLQRCKDDWQCHRIMVCNDITRQEFQKE